MTREELILLSECMKKAVPTLRSADTRTRALSAMAEGLVKESAYILEENKKDLATAEYFMTQVDCAAVYRNASTRFTDGGEFGLDAEIGISTQKLHVRGPFAAETLKTVQYRVLGNGETR